MGEAVHTLLEENKIFFVVVPNNCNDLFQPLDLSVHKQFKDKLQRGFSEWYSQEVAIYLTNGCQAHNIHIDTRMSIVKEMSCTWIMSVYEHICSSSDTVKTGFKKEGITSAIEKKLQLPQHFVATKSIDSEDPFNFDDD